MPALPTIQAPAAGLPARTLASLSAIHMTQFQGPDNPDGLPRAWNMECGPTSALMGLRALGLDVPGTNGARTREAIDAARRLGTGNTDDVPTVDSQLAAIGAASGARVQFMPALADAEAAVRGGAVALISGDCTATGFWRTPYVPPKNINTHAGHWVALSGYDAATGQYLVNDPLMPDAVAVPESQIATFHNAEPGAVNWGRAVVLTRP